MPISRNGKVYLHRYYYNKGLFQIKAISGLTKLVVRRGTAYFLLGTSISFICKLKSNKIGIVTDSRESNFQQFNICEFSLKIDDASNCNSWNFSRFELLILLLILSSCKS